MQTSPSIVTSSLVIRTDKEHPHSPRAWISRDELAPALHEVGNGDATLVMYVLRIDGKYCAHSLSTVHARGDELRSPHKRFCSFLLLAVCHIKDFSYKQCKG